jgi:Spy/CpxP family protein refolding chaperone
MHPGMMHWWRVRHQRAAECGTHAGWGPAGHRRFGYGPEESTYRAAPHRDDGGAGAFGVRRPLRFLAYKLGLDDEQVARLARILNDVKTERAQSDVDGRRTLTAFADAVMGATFDDQRAADGAALRVRSAEQLKDAVVKSLREIHGVLRPEQRERLAYLIRTGSLTL